MKEKNIFYNLTFKEVRGGLIAFRDNLDINKEVFLEGTFISNWPSDAKIYVKGKNPTDYLFYPLAPWFTVSRKVQQSIIEADIQGIQFLPVRIEHRSGVEIPGYAVLNVLEVIPALDYDHTEWMTPEREQVQFPELNIWKVALQLKKIKGKDIFRLAEVRTETYISEYFMMCLRRNKATLGFNFLAVRAIS